MPLPLRPIQPARRRDRRKSVVGDEGKSTIVLALGAAKIHQEKIHAIDPHKVLPEEKYFEDTEAEFFANIKQAGIHNQVAPLIMTSEEAARGWTKPIRLLWIDGDHRYESIKLDFALWEPHVWSRVVS